MFKEIKHLEAVHFATSIRFRITDHNYGNHVANNVFIEYLHEGRVRFLESLGYTEMDVEGAALILSELAVKFVQQAFYPDSMRLEIAVANLRGTRFDLLYRGFSEKGGLLILAKTEMAAVDYATGKPIRLPAALLERFEDL